MKAGWQTKKLGDVCEVIAGQSPEGKYYNSEMKGLPFYQGKKEFSEKFLGEPTTWTKDITKEARQGDVLMSVRAPVGPVNFATQRICIGRGLAAIRAAEVIDRDYLFNFLLKHESEVVGNTGAVFNSINKAQIENILIPLPSLPEQQRIVAILDEAFEGIATATANAKKNLNNARELFESHLQSVFTQRGEGWVEKKLGDTSILKIIDGDRGSNYPSKQDFSDDGFCLFLNTKNVRPDGFNFDATMFITEEKDKVLRKGKLQRQDVILTTRGTIGNVAIFDEAVEFENIRINSGMLIFRPNTGKILPSFLFEVFRSGIMKSQMTRHVSGAAQPQLPIKTLIDFEIPVPDTIESQRKIVASVREIDAETERLTSIYQQKLALLAELKKSLLQQAFSGELQGKPTSCLLYKH